MKDLMAVNWTTAAPSDSATTQPDALRLELDRLRAQVRRLEAEAAGEGRAFSADLQAQRLESLSTLAGGIAQDFNNLLVGILAHTGMALKALGSPSVGEVRAVRESLEQVEGEALRAADLARKLLAFSGKAHLNVHPLDLAVLLREMRLFLRGELRRSIELEMNLTPQLPLIEGDAAQIRQLMLHLVSNAADAIGDAPGRIRVGTGIVELEAGEGADLKPEALSTGRYIYVTVSDDGPGIGADALEKIFDPYFSTKASGQGLGLAVVAGIVQGHRGAFRVESRPGEGATFQVYFPCSPRSAPAAAMLASPSPSVIATVLVVDDDETVRKVTSKILETVGYRVLLARDGLEALAEVNEHGAEISLVLLDMRMPRMGGAETFEELRRLYPALPVILSSGYDPQERVTDLVGQGPTVFLHKPYSPQDLTAKMTLLLDAARQQR